MKLDIRNGVSVIVPIYNSEQYLEGCIKSVLEQTFLNTELILIDDGSSDKSPDICEQICLENESVIFVRQVHKGVSAARNAGLNLANGKYVFFLDSDDVIHPQLLEALYRLQEKNHSVIATTGFHFAGGGRFQQPSDWEWIDLGMQEGEYLGNDNAIRPYYLLNAKTWLCAIGGKMVYREAVKTVRFDEDLTNSEDMWFLFQLLKNGADVSALMYNWYYYRRGEKCKSKVFSAVTCRSRYQVEKNMRDYYINHGRLTDAVQMEKMLLDDLTQWRRIGRKKNDSQLVEYMKFLLKSERENGYFLKLNWYKRTGFYFCYLIYHFQRIISDIL